MVIEKIFNLEMRKTFFLYELSPELEQVTQRGCAVSVPGGFQTTTGSSLEQPGLTLFLTAWSEDLPRSLPNCVIF